MCPKRRISSKIVVNQSWNVYEIQGTMRLQTPVKSRANVPQVGARHVNSTCFTNRPSRSFVNFLAHASPQDTIYGEDIVN